jgi:hypothetical protein
MHSLYLQVRTFSLAITNENDYHLNLARSPGTTTD